MVLLGIKFYLMLCPNFLDFKYLLFEIRNDLTGLAFMTCSGTKNSRAKQALRNIGPAVLNGGFSTFISISLLARSQSLAFISFYKVG